MKTAAKFAILIFFAVAVWAWSQTGPPSTTDAQSSISDIARNYTNYSRITKSMVSVNPEFALLCAGVSKEAVDAARTKFGPHANTGILIYMNKPAADAFGKGAATFPMGSVIVKQKTIGGYFGEDGKLVRDADTGVGGMVKRSPGYDPQHGDWEYFYFEDAGKIESGRISSCVQCHESAKGRDYVFGTWNESSR
jgi:Cytochrome P460